MSAQVIQCNTVQNHQAEAVIRKYNTSTECTSLKVLIKIQHVSRSTAYNIQISHIHDICLLIQKVCTYLNRYNISNIENKYRPDVISQLQYHSCAHYPCTLTSVLYLTHPCGTPANGRKRGPNQE